MICIIDTDKCLEPGIVVHTSDPSTWDTKTDLQVWWGQPGLCREFKVHSLKKNYLFPPKFTKALIMAIWDNRSSDYFFFLLNFCVFENVFKHVLIFQTAYHLEFIIAQARDIRCVLMSKPGTIVHNCNPSWRIEILKLSCLNTHWFIGTEEKKERR